MPPPLEADARHNQAFVTIVITVVCYVTLVLQLYLSPSYWKQDYHTSALSGWDWVQELIKGHPDRIHTELGVKLHVFYALLIELRILGLEDSKHIRLEESLAIFLYTCVTGLTVDHVAERFQHSKSTITEHFKKILDGLTLSGFYGRHVRLPSSSAPIPTEILTNPKWFPWFKGVLGAIDGTHLPCCPPAAELHTARDRKGRVTQNCLAAVSFDMRFLFFVSGWDGCASDSTMYSQARLKDFFIPTGRSYLADAGFGICKELFVPYRSVRYHLAEWGRADQRPATPKELYNLRHATARNVVERIFGVIKSRWEILSRPPRYSMEIQAQIPAALVALHNFILTHDEHDLEKYMDDDGNSFDNEPGFRRDQEIDIGRLSATGTTSRSEKREAEAVRDTLAQAMWEDYQQVLADRMDVD